MRFYRVHVNEDAEGSMGYEWFTNRREAMQCKRSLDVRYERDANELYDMDQHISCEIEAVDVAPSKAGILRALRLYASHPDNG